MLDASSLGGPTNLPTITRDERTFLAWLAQLTPETRRLSGRGERPAVSLERLCRAVLDSVYPLPSRYALRLGLPSDTPVGEAARLLLWATCDDEGPRCSSYRAAAFHLRDQHRRRTCGGHPDVAPSPGR